MRITLAQSAEPPPPPGTDDKISRDDRSALVCCHEPEYREYLHTQLRPLGFKVHHAPSAQVAIQRLTVRSYQVIVLLENLEGCTLQKNPMLRHLTAMPMDERRGIYLVMLCQAFATGDELNAYAQSVDLLINYQDIANFAELMAPALEDHEIGNRHFQAIWQELGQ